MLPSYNKTEKKMYRHGYSGLNGDAYIGSRDQGTFIAPAKFQPRSQPLSRHRRQFLTRLALGLLVFLSITALIFPPTRPYIFFPLSLFAASEDFKLETVRYYDLSATQGTARGWERGERVLLCAPLRDASSHLKMFFGHLNNLTYPHNLIDLAFLVGDSKDNTLVTLTDMLTKLQAHPDPKMRFGEISIIEKDFGQKVEQDVESRHGFAAQASRRKSMAQARNWLLSAALRPTHSWVYWRDVDVEVAPRTILEDLMKHNKDIIVPNVWRPLPDWLGGEQPYDLNSWQESETALALADTLDEDAVIVEGYAEYATWRPHLAYLRDPFGDPDVEMEIDGVGGVSILAKAKVFRWGVHFPAFSFEKHAETEGFGKMAKRMDLSVVGLPHYTIWHLYEPSVDDVKRMKQMEKDKKKKAADELAKKQKEQAKKDAAARIKDQFADAGAQWSKDKDAIRQANEKHLSEKEKEYAELAAKKEKQVQQDVVDESIYGPDGKARHEPPVVKDGLQQKAAVPKAKQDPKKQEDQKQRSQKNRAPAQPAPLRKPPTPANAFVNGEAPGRLVDEQ